MKHFLNIVILIIATNYISLGAVERFASGLCTHYLPKFVNKPILDDNGNKIGEKQVIDIGNGQEIKAGEDWDSSWLASNDDRITFDYDIKTRRVYRCNQINVPAEKEGLAVECHRRGFDYGFFTNGAENCFTTWDYQKDYASGHPEAEKPGSQEAPASEEETAATSAAEPAALPQTEAPVSEAPVLPETEPAPMPAHGCDGLLPSRCW